MTSKSDLKRLGRRSSYRLGQLRTQGVAPAGPPPLLRPRFRRPWHRGPGPLWLLAAAAGAAVIAGGATAGLWFAPLIAGLAAGLWLAGLWLGRALTSPAGPAAPDGEAARPPDLGAAGSDVSVLAAGIPHAGVPGLGGGSGAAARPRCPTMEG